MPSTQIVNEIKIFSAKVNQLEVLIQERMKKLVFDPESMMQVKGFLSNNKENIRSCQVDVLETIFKVLQIFSEKFKKLDERLKPTQENA
jgi:hypothetical protein